MPHDLFSTR